MVFIEMRRVGADRMSARLAADLWANRAQKIVLEVKDPSGIIFQPKTGDDRPVLPARFFAAAWHEFCRSRGIDPRGVWFSDGVPDPAEGFFSVRGRNRINPATGAACAHFLEASIGGRLVVTARYPLGTQQRVSEFRHALDPSYCEGTVVAEEERIRFGRNRHLDFGDCGALRLLEVQAITPAEAKEWEESVVLPKDSPAATRARRIARVFRLGEGELAELKQLFFFLCGSPGLSNTGWLTTNLQYWWARHRDSVLARRSASGRMSLLDSILQALGRFDGRVFLMELCAAASKQGV